MSTRALFAAISLCAAAPAAADSLRCAGGIVGVGDTKLDLLGKCGEPAYVDAEPTYDDRARRWTVSAEVAVEERVRWPVERWTYDLGPGLFVQHVALTRGRVVAVERGGRRGSEAEPRPAMLVRARCESSAIRVGDHAADVVAACGEPAVRDVGRRARLERVRLVGDGQRRSVSAALEVWAYDFGPQRFTAIVRIEDGVVRAVDRGGYGYAPER